MQFFHTPQFGTFYYLVEPKTIKWINLIFRMQELAWLIKNEVDLEKAQSNQFFRVPFIELGSVIPPIAIEKV